MGPQELGAIAGILGGVAAATGGILAALGLIVLLDTGMGSVDLAGSSSSEA